MMNLPDVVADLLDKIAPADVRDQWAAEKREAEMTRRRGLAAEHGKTEAEAATAIGELDARITKAGLLVARRRQELRAAEAQHAEVAGRRLALIAQRDRARTIFTREMRQTAPAEVLEELAARVDVLLRDAVPATERHTVRSSLGANTEISLSGDARARREQLYALQRAIRQDWGFEALSTEAFAQRFASAVANVPPVVPPMTLADYLARQAA